MSDLRQKAIENMIEYAKQGNMEALKDLVVLLHPSNYSQKVLMDIYISESASNMQREFISSQSQLFSKFEMQRSIKIQLAKDGDIGALADIINILEAEEADVYNNPVPDGKSSIWIDVKISEALEKIFISGKSSPEQKELIWLHKDVVVRIDSNKNISSEQSISEYEDDDGHMREWVDVKAVDVVHRKKISFADYIKKR